MRPSGALVCVTPFSRRFFVPLLVPVALATLLAAGCGKQQPGQGQGVSPTGSASPTSSGTAKPSGSATTSAPPLLLFQTDGAGPYILGKTLTQLQATPGLDDVTPNPNCPGNTTARGKGDWSGIHLNFRPDGKLYLVVNKSQDIPTPSGAALGTNLTAPNQFSPKGLKDIYAGLVTYDLTRGGATAFLVQTLGGGGILFELNANKDVDAMYAGDAMYLRNTFQVSGTFC